MSHPDEFGQSKKRFLDTRKGRNHQRKFQKRKNFNNDTKAQIQCVKEKLFNAKLKEIDGDKSKKVFFKVSEANAEAWVEETMKKINKKNGSMGAASMQEFMKEVHAVPQGIKVTIDGKKPSKSQKK